MGCWGASANLERAPRACDGIAACPAISPTRFGWINFLDLLRAGHTDYVINEAALDDMRRHAPAGVVNHQLAVYQLTRLPYRASDKRIPNASTTEHRKSHRIRSVPPPQGRGRPA
jgi:hypothetical protein